MFKRFMCFLGIGLTLVSLAGCKGKKEPELKYYEYNELEINLGEDEAHGKIKVVGDNLYFTTYQYPEYPPEYDEELENIDNAGSEADAKKLYAELEEKYSEYKPKVILWKYNIASAEKTAMYEKVADSFNISEFEILEDGSALMLCTEYIYDEENDTSENMVTLNKVDTNGQETMVRSLNDYFQKEESGEDQEEMMVDVSNAAFDSDGTLYMIYEMPDGEKSKNYYNKISSDGELISTVQNESSFGGGNGAVINNEGKLVVGDYEENGMCYRIVDFDNNKLSEPLPGLSGDRNTYVDYELLGSSQEYGLLIKDQTYMYSYKEEDKEPVPVLKWMDCGVAGEGVRSITPLPDGTFICSIMNNMDGSTQIGIMKEKENDDAGKEVITLASQYTDTDMQQSIIAFNKSNDKYKIDYKTYDNTENSEEAFANDIISGNTPDIIDLSGMNPENYIAKGLLTDLTPYMENDDTVNKDYFIDGILDKSQVDGKQYYLFKSFNITSIAGKASELARYKDNWSLDSLIDYYKSKPEGTLLFERDSKQRIFSLFLDQQYASCVDYATGKVSFDNDEFRKFLEFCNTFPNDEEETYDDSLDTHKMIKKGKLLLQNCVITSIDDFTLNNKLFEGDIEYIGYPTAQKGSTYIAYPSTVLSISSTAKNADAAWEFIKFVFSQNKDAADTVMYTIPAVKPDFDNMIKRAMATEAYTDENGNKIEPRNMVVGYNDFTVEIGPATEEEVNTLKNLIAEASGIINPSYESQNIITEEVYKYFNGEKSLDETINIIQDKMNKYINENR